LPSVPGDLPATLLARRPDLVAAERRLAAADKRVAEAKRSLYPRLSLTASAGTASQELEDLVDGDFSVWSLIGNLAAPLFQGGRLRANVALSRSRTEEAVALFADAALRAFAEVENTLTAEEHLAHRESHLAESAEQAEAARVVAEEQYRSGLVNYITVLESQRRALLARSELIAVRRARMDARVDLHLALGGGFTLEEIPGFAPSSPNPSARETSS
jgi:outer membrane protein TolC